MSNNVDFIPPLVRAQFLPPVGRALVEYLIERETARDPWLALMMAAAEKSAQREQEQRLIQRAALEEDVPW